MMSKNVIKTDNLKGAGTVEQEGDITMNKVYTFRKLNSTDIFLMFKIMSKIGITEFAKCFEKDTVKELVASANGGDSKKDMSTVVGIAVALEAANVILGNLPKCEVEIYQMLANTSNLSVEKIKKLDFITFTEMVIDFIKKEEFKDFIKVVSGFFKPGK